MDLAVKPVNGLLQMDETLQYNNVCDGNQNDDVNSSGIFIVCVTYLCNLFIIF